MLADVGDAVFVAVRRDAAHGRIENVRPGCISDMSVQRTRVGQENDMKFRTIMVLTGIVLLLAVAWLIQFALSDFVSGPLGQEEIIATKPWRPWCRLIFSVIVVAIMIVGTIGFLKYKAEKT